MRCSILFAFGGSLLLLPAVGYAQRGGAAPRMSMTARPAVAAPHAMAHAVGPAMHVPSGSRLASLGPSARLRVGNGPARRPRSGSPGTTTRRRFSNDEFGAPGLGFDETHFRATHHGRHDRFRHRNDFTAFFPFFDGGFFLPSAPFEGDDIAGEGPPEEYADNDYPEPSPHARTHYRAQAEEAPVISRDVVPQPPVKTDEYVFVRRDGSLFFAVAYAWDRDTLRYVTSEGLRHSAARDSLDLNATQQFNEQRGVTFRDPA
jgi:hypothetical protein